MVTRPSAAGVIVAPYSAPLPANAPAAPLPTTMSSRVKPVTGLLNLNLALNGPLTAVGTSRMATVGGGAVRPYTDTACCAATLPLPKPSCAAFCGTSMVTGPSAVGVIVAAYSAPLPPKLEAAPLPTTMSSTVKPVTGSLNLNLALNGALLKAGTSRIDTVVAVPSNSDSACGAARLPLPKLSCATFAGTSMVTEPSAAGVISAAYSAPLPPNAPAAPLPTTMSSRVKPVTGSLNVNLALNGALLTGGTSRIDAVGAVLSYTDTACGAARLPLPMPSCAAFAGTSTVTEPSAAGVISAVYSVPAVAMTSTPAAPLPTTMSSTVKPVTGLLNLNLALNGALLAAGTSRIATVGAVPLYAVTACSAARLPMPAPSCATFSGTSMVTEPSAAGVISAP